MSEEELPKIFDDPDALRALEVLLEKGYSPNEIEEALDWLDAIESGDGPDDD